MPVLGAGREQHVRARAVAGYESVSAGVGIGALDPTAAPGLTVDNGGTLLVNGRIMINGLADPAAAVIGDGQVKAAAYKIVGPAVLGRFAPYPGTSGQLALNQPPLADPLINLPTPASITSRANDTATPLNPAWSTQTLGSPVVADGDMTGLMPPNYLDTNGVVQLHPGVYRSITINGGKVRFNPGVYILSPSPATPYSLDVTGGSVTGDGVMFYNTGGDFLPSTGYPDNDDANLYDPDPAGTNLPPSGSSFQDNFGGIRIDSSKAVRVSLSAIANEDDPFDQVLIYQRRANMQPIQITGGNLSLTGTLYAKWAPFRISGGGAYQAQFIGGRMRVTGPATLSLDHGATFGRAEEVFLVE